MLPGYFKRAITGGPRSALPLMQLMLQRGPGVHYDGGDGWHQYSNTAGTGHYYPVQLCTQTIQLCSQCLRENTAVYSVVLGQYSCVSVLGTIQLCTQCLGNTPAYSVCQERYSCVRVLGTIQLCTQCLGNTPVYSVCQERYICGLSVFGTLQLCTQCLRCFKCRYQ